MGFLKRVQGAISWISNLTSGTIFEIKSENGKILDIDADGKLTMTRMGDSNKRIEIFENNITLTGNSAQGNYINGNSNSYIRFPVSNGYQYFQFNSNSADLQAEFRNEVNNKIFRIYSDKLVGTGGENYPILSFSNYIGGTITLGATTSTLNFPGYETKIVSSNGRLSEQTPSQNSGKNIVLETGVGYFSGSDGNILLNATNNGLIGIGTTTPTYKLHVNDGDFLVKGVSTGDGGIAIKRLVNGYNSITWISNNVGIGLIVGGGIGAYVKGAAGFNISPFPSIPSLGAMLGIRTNGNTSSTDAMKINNQSNITIFNINDAGDGYFQGNLGIGTTSPTNKLHIDEGILRIENAPPEPTTINSVRENGIRLDAGSISSYAEIRPYNGGSNTRIGLSFWASNTTPTEVVRIQPNGDVGIGTSTPSTKLDVDGEITVAIERWTIDLMDDTSTTLYADDAISITAVDNIVNAPTTTITINGSAYTLGNSISLGDEIGITVSTASVIKLKIEK